MSVGTAVAVISYISRIFSPIESIGMEIQTIQEALAGAKRVGEFLELPTRLETSGEAGEKVMVELGRAGSVSGSDYAAAAGSDRAAAAEPAKSPAVACISLEDVSFGYEEEKMVLKHLSFEIKTGEQVTMTGRTGAGKSTIFKLLLGLYRPQKGCVKYMDRTLICFRTVSDGVCLAAWSRALSGFPEPFWSRLRFLIR